MKEQSILLASLAATLIPLVLLTNPQKGYTQPQGCIFLKEVSTGATSIRKNVSDNILGNNNWNTDFAVPTGTAFNYFIGRVYPQNNATYFVTVNFKYNDNTSAQAFKKNVPMQRLKLYQQDFRTPTQKQPYQINMNVGSNVNNAYSVAVLACKY